MAYPTEQDVLAAVDPPPWIDRHFLRQDPFAFESQGVDFHQFACGLSAALDVERNGIFCIGSGAIGLSVSPRNVQGGHLKAYDDASDLDVAIISSWHFESAWRELLQATQPHLSEVPDTIRQNLTWQRKRLFDGAILANKLIGSLSFGPQWIGAIDRFSGRLSDQFDRNVTIEAWIYRNYWSLRNYVGSGLVACQRKLRASDAA